MNVCEIFKSIQGESTFAGRPCVFVRLTGCNLRCSYCDTQYAWDDDGTAMNIDTIVTKVAQFGCNVVEITGGEPLFQNDTIALLEALDNQHGYTLLLETNGSLPLQEVPPDVHIIMDIKCPASGESGRVLWENLRILKAHDEIKLVISDEMDYEWAKETYKTRLETKGCEVLFSPVAERLQPRRLAEWILRDGLGVRFQLQLHKYLWPPHMRSV